MMIDCGEGTWGSLVRNFGEAAALALVRGERQPLIIAHYCKPPIITLNPSTLCPFTPCPSRSLHSVAFGSHTSTLIMLWALARSSPIGPMAAQSSLWVPMRLGLGWTRCKACTLLGRSSFFTAGGLVGLQANLCRYDRFSTRLHTVFWSHSQLLQQLQLHSTTLRSSDGHLNECHGFEQLVICTGMALQVWGWHHRCGTEGVALQVWDRAHYH
jgi:hypothetical protein